MTDKKRLKQLEKELEIEFCKEAFLVDKLNLFWDLAHAVGDPFILEWKEIIKYLIKNKKHVIEQAVAYEPNSESKGGSCNKKKVFGNKKSQNYKYGTSSILVGGVKIKGSLEGFAQGTSKTTKKSTTTQIVSNINDEKTGVNIDNHINEDGSVKDNRKPNNDNNNDVTDSKTTTETTTEEIAEGEVKGKLEGELEIEGLDGLNLQGIFGQQGQTLNQGVSESEKRKKEVNNIIDDINTKDKSEKKGKTPPFNGQIKATYTLMEETKKVRQMVKRKY